MKNILLTALPFALAAASVVVFLNACTKQQVAQVASITARGADCIDKTVTEHPEMSPAEVLLTCSLEQVPELVGLVAAKKARLAAARAARCP